MKIAVVQIRGTVRTGSKIKDTLKLLRLTKKNSCVLLENNPVYLGMLVKLKDFVTWGEVNNETLKSLIEKMFFAIITPLIGWIVDIYSLEQALFISGILVLFFGAISLVLFWKEKTAQV